MGNKRFWTDEERKELQDLVSQGLTAREISDKLKRSVPSVEGQIKQRKISMVESQTSQVPAFSVPEAPANDLTLEEIFEIRSKLYSRKEEHKAATKVVPVTVNVPGPIAIAFIGDPHLDDDNTDLELIRRHVEVLSSTEGLFGVCVGDYTNNWVGRLEKLYAKQTTTRLQAHVLTEWFFRSVNWMVAVGGNHDAWNHGNEILKLMSRITGTYYYEHGGRFEIKLPSGASFTLNTRHDFKGRSQYNPAFGANKSAMFGSRDDLHVAGHLHQDGYQTQRIDGKRVHAIRVGAYKRFDEYAVENGFSENDNSPAYVAVIDPDKFGDDGFIQVFCDFDSGVQYLKLLRNQREIK